MNVRRRLLFTLSHLACLMVGVAAGIYALPLLVAPAAPDAATLGAASAEGLFTGTFRRSLRDSDLLHWGEGQVTVGAGRIVIEGRLAPGPDYKLYLSPSFVETEHDFERVRPEMVRIADVRSFGNSITPVPPTVDVNEYTTVVIWCESFSQFITAAQYQPPR